VGVKIFVGVRGPGSVGVQKCLMIGCCPLILEATLPHHSTWEVMHRVIPQRTSLHRIHSLRQWMVICRTHIYTGMGIPVLKNLEVPVKNASFHCRKMELPGATAVERSFINPI
jgi:hypothetical protein